MRGFLNKTYTKHKALIWATLILVVLRIPSLFEPHWYLDEGMYVTIGEHIASGHTLYLDIYDHKPQLIFHLYALFSYFGNTILVAKLANILAGVVTLLGIAKLSRHFEFHSRARAATLLLAALMLGTPMLEGNIANAENFFLPLTVWGLYLALQNSMRKRVLAGVLFGVAMSIKLHPILDLYAACIYIVLLASAHKKPVQTTINKLAPIVAGIIMPFMAFFLIDILQNTFDLYLQAAYLDAYAYAGASVTGYIQQTPTKILLLLGGTALFVIMFKSKQITKAGLFIGLLVISEGFAAVLSGRVYYHYLLQLVPGAALLGGYLIHLYYKEKKPGMLILRTFTLSCAVLVFAAFFNSSYALPYQNPNRRFSDNWFADEYYLNFFEHALLGTIGSADYNLFFSDRPQKLVRIDLLMPDDAGEDDVYIYSDLGWAYPHTNKKSPTRVFVAFQLFYRDDNRDQIATIYELSQANPKYLIIDSTKETFDALDEFVADNYMLAGREGEFVLYSRQ